MIWVFNSRGCRIWIPRMVIWRKKKGRDVHFTSSSRLRYSFKMWPGWNLTKKKVIKRMDSQYKTSRAVDAGANCTNAKEHMKSNMWSYGSNILDKSIARKLILRYDKGLESITNMPLTVTCILRCSWNGMANMHAWSDKRGRYVSSNTRTSGQKMVGLPCVGDLFVAMSYAAKYLPRKYTEHTLITRHIVHSPMQASAYFSWGPNLSAYLCKKGLQIQSTSAIYILALEPIDFP